MAQLEVFEQGVEGHAVEGTPGAVEVPTSLSLLPAVVVVHKLVQHKLGRLGAGHSCRVGTRGGGVLGSSQNTLYIVQKTIEKNTPKH